MDEEGFSFTDPQYRPLDDVIDRSAGPEVVRVRRRSPWFTWVRVVAGMFALIVLYGVVTLAQVVHTGAEYDAGPADAIVVLGAAQYDGRPSPQLAARLDHVVTLWRDGTAPFVMVTGGKQPGDRFTEAEASARYLENRGVPASAILMESDGSTTYESLDAAATLLAEIDRTSIVLVTDPYHAYRAKLTAEEVGLSVDVASTPTSVVTGWTAVRRDLQEAAGVAVGRLVGFGRLSDWTD
jgi:uncharacterized SAM-binding protein YcdF (DUF218 family)